VNTIKKLGLILWLIGFMSLANLISTVSYAKIGSGELYVYYDSDYESLVHQDEKGFYEVVLGQTLYIQITDITEFSVTDPPTLITVKICWDYTEFKYPCEVEVLDSGVGVGQVGVGDNDNPIEWTVGWFNGEFHEIPVCETMTIHYKYKSPDYIATFWDADRGMAVTAHLHHVPENPWGTFGTILTLLAGFALYFTRFRNL